MMDQFTRNSITQELYEEGSRGRVRFSGRLDITNATKDALGISMRHLDAEGGNGDAVVQPVREVVPRGLGAQMLVQRFGDVSEERTT